jgi:hypothetical protein
MYPTQTEDFFNTRSKDIFTYFFDFFKKIDEDTLQNEISQPQTSGLPSQPARFQIKSNA